MLMQVKELSNVKEEVYGALDSFIAWDLEFPLITVKKALKILQNEQEWKRIIQVTDCHLILFFSLFLSFLWLSTETSLGFVGDKVDVKQRSRKNDGNLFHLTECFSTGWET